MFLIIYLQERQRYTSTEPRELEQTEMKLAELEARKECLTTASDKVSSFHREKNLVNFKAYN